MPEVIDPVCECAKPGIYIVETDLRKESLSHALCLSSADFWIFLIIFSAHIELPSLENPFGYVKTDLQVSSPPAALRLLASC